MGNLLNVAATVAAIYMTVSMLQSGQRATRSRRFRDRKAMVFELWANRVTAIVVVLVLLGAIWL